MQDVSITTPQPQKLCWVKQQTATDKVQQSLSMLLMLSQHAASNMMQQSLSLLLQASKTGKQQAEAGQKKLAAAQRKRQPVVLSDSAGSEEEEEEQPSSEDETERLEIERVLDGRPHANSKQEEFLVKFKGSASSLHAPCILPSMLITPAWS